MTIIKQVELHEFEFNAKNLGNLTGADSVGAFGYLKGPTDMLTYYENRYKNAIQQFAGMQLGRRRRDDYTDGTVRIPVKSPSP